MNYLFLLTPSFSLKNVKNISHFSSLFMKKEKSNFFEFAPEKYVPKNENQKHYVNCLNNNSIKIVMAIGPAGTGKTMFACIEAIELLKKKKLNKIILTRPIIPVEEEELGFLPGNLVKKMDPWTRPILDIFMEYYSKSEIEKMIYNNIIEISPLAYMRGRTFKNAFIIADEMQNSTPNQMLMLTTRLGINSKLIITGDLKQTDRSSGSNGLLDLINKKKIYDKYNNDSNDIELIEFKKEDIERSPIVQKIINIYEWKEVLEKKIDFEKKPILNFKKEIIQSDAALIPIYKLPKN